MQNLSRHPFMERITGRGIVITDGAWGTELQKRGLKQGQNPDAWNLSNPAAVEEIPRGYVQAGSRIVLTNTFGANRYILEKYGLAGEVRSINIAGVEISKKAAGEGAYVFASIGPTGKVLNRKADGLDDLTKAFDEQAHALQAGGADAIVIETMMDLREALSAAKAAKMTGLPVVACMVFNAGKGKDRTMMGDTIEAAVQAFTDAGVDAIGVNCGQDVTGFVPICRRMRSLTTLPLWMKPNAGLPSFEQGVTSYKTGPQEFAEGAMELIKAGADFIGGCCGTNPDYIRTLAEKIGV
jgi:5-methyltetrahydrofolate--homocysteine methyltransferase